MQALVSSLERVVEAADWFVRTPSVRLLHITTNSMMRNAVLAHVAATEMLPHARAPFFVLEFPCEPEELRFDWSRLVATAPEGVHVASLPDAGGLRSPLGNFAADLALCLERLPDAARNLVVVFAPVWIRTSDGCFSDGAVAARWRDDLEQLLRSPTLARARFVVVETDSNHTAPLAARLGEAADCIDATPDEDAVRAESEARLANMRAAPRGATGARCVGGAGPAVAPPRRVGAITPSSEPGAFDPDAMRELHIALLSAAAAMRNGDVVRAATEQRAAVDLCVRRGMLREALVNELVLAGYVLSASPEQARTLFATVEARATELGHHDLAAQARMAVAACHALLGATLDAATEYAEAGRIAERAGSIVIAIEAFRTAGQLLVSHGELERGALAFRRALEVAGAANTPGTSAPSAARALAALCRSHGLTTQATSLDAQAQALEAMPLSAATSVTT